MIAKLFAKRQGSLQHTNYETGYTHTELRLISCKKRVEASKLKQTVAANRQPEHAAVVSAWNGRGPKAKLTNGNKPVLNRSLTL